MQIRDTADRLAILDRNIDMLRDRFTDHTFKILVDRETVQALYQSDHPAFFEFADKSMRYRDIPVERNDYVNGIWIQFH